MIVDKIRFRGHQCFKKEWSGFDSIKPINVIIGRNNTGKSHLLDLVKALCENTLKGRGWEFHCAGVMDDKSLLPHFSGYRDGELQGRWWEDHGNYFVNQRIEWTANNQLAVTDLKFDPKFDYTSRFGERSTKDRLERIKKVAGKIESEISGTVFRRLLADRDIRPERPSTELELLSDGSGATNIIRRHIVTSSPRYPREVIQIELLAALNEIFAGDGNFTEIQVKLHDEPKSTGPDDHWEVFLGEQKKGLIPLSSSGSGLKTVILVLLNLIAVPRIDEKGRSGFTFAFEELENNLHPALLRRLLQYLENYAVKERVKIFLTTHSSTALDIFGISKNAQIIHVTHDGEMARAVTVSAHFDQLGVISELGAKPSDLLQANGVIWVEGPSDCIYLNRWIDIYSGGRLQEGRDYLCAFYGGSLLARTQFKSPEEAEKDLVNLFRVNANIFVICDGDRAAKGARVKDRVRRICAEVKKIPRARIWVTEGREIESYIPGDVLSKALGLTSLPDPTRYELIFPRKGAPGTSYVENRLNRKGIDKMDLAIQCVPYMDKGVMSMRFEWDFQMKALLDLIDSWNR